jgi:solute carrier family 25 S-adenosylmethionine transporter 26
MVCGAISRSIAQTVMHPANTMKTILQSSRGVDRPTVSQLMRPAMFKGLTRGAGANFILSVPHGAVNFAVLEFVRGRLNSFVESVPWLEERSEKIGPGLDFSSSAISTICCSVVSTPQMMITDNIMVGNYPRLSAAIRGLYKDRGIMGFYSGWWPGLVGKIPSYVSSTSSGADEQSVECSFSL